MNSSKIFLLEGLDCADCAAKIESRIKKVNGLKSASVDFISQKMTLELDEGCESDEVIQKVNHIVNEMEPDVIIKSENEARKSKSDSMDKNQKIELIKLITGMILFTAAAFIFKGKVSLALYIVSYVLIGGEILLKMVKNISMGNIFDENFLMSVATIGAFCIKQYPEAVSVMLFYKIGELIEDTAVDRSRKSISDLMDIRPDYANLIKDGEIKKVSPEEIKIGDLISVRPGEKIPLDGKVREGNSMVDTSALTGESVPREVKASSDVLSGFINKNGLLTVEVTKEFHDSTVSKILDLMQNASSKKAPTENFITKFARYYTPIVVATAAALAIIPPIFVKGAVFSNWIYRALVFLVVSCPCAFVISVPLSFFGGIGGASKKGILVKGSSYLEALNSVDTVVFDKTGTLTKGVFKVTEIKPVKGITEDELLEYAAYAESYSNHPIAFSLMKRYEKEIDKKEIKNYTEISGYGIKADVRGKEILAGNAKLMKKENISCDTPDSIGTCVHVASDGRYIGYIIISDEIKEDSKNAISALKNLGIRKTVMLTGDSKKVADKVSAELGLDSVYSELLPDQKVQKMEEINSSKLSNGKLVYVGDGINDAPVLAMSDIGIAMGGLGSDAAIEAADVVIMNDEPSRIAAAIKIAKRTRKIVWQNIIFALVVKITVLILASLGIATIWEGVFADVGVTLIAIINAMRALNVKNI